MTAGENPQADQWDEATKAIDSFVEEQKQRMPSFEEKMP